jgi:hypothetical protein
MARATIANFENPADSAFALKSGSGGRRPIAAFGAAALFAACLFAAIVTTGCTSSIILPGEAAKINKQVASCPLIVAFEGLQPFSGFTARNVAHTVADDVGAAASATSGNWLAHLGFAQEAHKHHQPIYIIGYSLGASDALQLAKACSAAKVPVRILFLLDPAALPTQVPDTVAHVVEIRSDSMVLWPHNDITPGTLQNARTTELEVVDLHCTAHGYLPYDAEIAIRARIGSDMSAYAPVRARP